MEKENKIDKLVGNLTRPKSGKMKIDCKKDIKCRIEFLLIFIFSQIINILR